MKIINSLSNEFGKAESFKELYNICKTKNYFGSRDEFLLTINKLKDKSLLRVSDLIGGFDDIYSPEVVVHTPDDKKNEVLNKPKIIVTELAKKLISYLEETPT